MTKHTCGDNNGHAIILTGRTEDGGYYWIDPQMMAQNPMAENISGVIYGNDPKLIGVYGGYTPQ